MKHSPSPAADFANDDFPNLWPLLLQMPSSPASPDKARRILGLDEEVYKGEEE